MMKDLDERYMRMALRLAEKARGRTSPNPMVGAVVVKNGKVVASGYHHRAGEPHAEALALAKAGKAAKGATLYVTLEPCSHRNKRTPPCAPLVVSSGLKRVVIAMRDPNPQVGGGGERTLRKAGIGVTTGVLEAEARKLNEAYLKYITTGLPFVTIKVAQTLDGKIATARGESKWITGSAAREEGHLLRDANDAVLVGINTVLKDDPLLTARVPGGRDPVRVVVDSRLRLPPGARILTQRSDARTIVATLAGAPEARKKKLESAGAEVLQVRSRGGRVDLRDLMRQLGTRDIMSVLIEGGAEVHASALAAGIVNKAVIFIAPTLMTGRDSVSSIGGPSPRRLKDAIRLCDAETRVIGRDLMVEGYIQRNKGRGKK